MQSSLDVPRLMLTTLAPCVAAKSRPCATHIDRKSTRLNSSHTVISYAVFCLKKKKKRKQSKRRIATSTIEVSYKASIAQRHGNVHPDDSRYTLVQSWPLRQLQAHTCSGRYSH